MKREWRKLPVFDVADPPSSYKGILYFSPDDLIAMQRTYFAEGMRYVLEHERHADADGSLAETADAVEKGADREIGLGGKP